MAGLTKTYDPGQVSILAGVRLLTGWDEVTIDRAEPGVKYTVGTQGEVCRTISYNKLGTIAITYPQSNDENEIMSAYEISKAAIPITVIDKSGKTVAIMEYGTVTKPATTKFGNTAENRPWVFEGNLPFFYVGGNNAES